MEPRLLGNDAYLVSNYKYKRIKATLIVMHFQVPSSVHVPICGELTLGLDVSVLTNLHVGT